MATSIGTSGCPQAVVPAKTRGPGWGPRTKDAGRPGGLRWRGGHREAAVRRDAGGAVLPRRRRRPARLGAARSRSAAAQARGRYLVCPICFQAKALDPERLLENAEVGGTIPMWQWIGDEGATTFSY
ncbi:hypothetical protein [Pimelobacter simplex]|uniref:hypothetical protein n=1 Tax=Nocardioides simplex TaxID=2045 RepID=UPI00214FEC09|nr:hypothetical protein [Pimelobacter simplex]UUW87242.1 hypothetical protein M0M43_15975 [Pimelobacter simplex]UUW96748.1 hypothetical protein M0M48_04620 [Pimelobacter simplex]